MGSIGTTMEDAICALYTVCLGSCKDDKDATVSTL
ncbi:hypothetical protein BOVA713_1894 [Bacteroides ovatus]|nr:hypothetical protein BOVA713_1894 [Bacteroides ovatus]